MRGRHSGFVALLAVVAAFLPLAAGAARTTTIAPLPAGPLVTAVMDPQFLEPNPAGLFLHARAAGATFVRIAVDWATIAPRGATAPAHFDPTDPKDQAYDWTVADRTVRAAVARGLKPIVSVYGAPAWAQPSRPAAEAPSDGAFEPSAKDFGVFARTIATRYDGRHGLPKVVYWQAWNEPNLVQFLAPLRSGGKLFAPIRYRELLNAFADSVHAASPANVVIAGGLSPFTIPSGLGATIGPMAFMRALLCMSTGARPRPTCAARASFDVWAIQPYTSGNAFHKANNPNDVSLGDLGKMRTLLAAAAAAGHVVSSRPVREWVTEVAWDTNPPDTNAVPIALQARWVSEALWQCWRNGIDLVTWFMLRDQPFVLNQPFQSGLYFRGDTVAQDKRKPSFTAFRFPFVAYPRGGRTYVWGRTPDSKPGTVVIQEKVGFLGYDRAGTLKANRYGIFEGYVAAGSINDSMRARVRGESSLDFALKAPPDRFVHPFG